MVHAPGSDFLFAYLDNDWDPSTTKAVTDAFKEALKMSTKIKDAVKTTSGQAVVDGLYLLDQPAMTKAMNSIDGMGLTASAQHENQGSGTAVGITKEFFQVVLGGLTGDVAPMLKYLTTQMGDVQAQVKKNTVTDTFGVVVGLISVMPVLEVPVTSFQYVFSSAETSQWFVDVLCVSTDHYSYDYKYTVANYNYVKS
ncbi:hypothetical protein Q4512_11210 [Oceanihabitans sp. 2_MG-2023]|uniref:hypothetical protein n=1 Tax=Oceanihabitans sp. 2_MG-2023 TaxID=3062661 RepID=UPI0026E47C28|nr:hypothetical protein [Oceanihabitans sp. 2_MG-2023]MDO6597485.1 hypothetical protein [Oceanihabitans sp. 2_MG-2023]